MDKDLQSRRRGMLEGALMLSDQKGSRQPPPRHVPILAHACMHPTDEMQLHSPRVLKWVRGHPDWKEKF